MRGLQDQEEELKTSEIEAIQKNSNPSKLTNV